MEYGLDLDQKKVRRATLMNGHSLFFKNVHPRHAGVLHRGEYKVTSLHTLRSNMYAIAQRCTGVDRVAILCNHQRGVTTGHEGQMEKLEAKKAIDELGLQFLKKALSQVGP